MISEEHDGLRTSVRNIVCDHFPRERIRQFESSEQIPSDLWRDVTSRGLLGIGIPEVDGGQGGGLLETAIVIEELARGSLSLAMRFLASVYSGVHTLHRVGTEQQRAAYLGRYLRGEGEFAFGFTEPSGGTDFATWVTRASPTDGGWRISGLKSYCTNADNALRILLMARTGAHGHRRDAYTLFLVDPSAEGVSLDRISTMGQRALRSFELALDDVFVPNEDVVGEIGTGLSVVFNSLDVERILVAAAAIGNAAAAFDDSLAYARERHAFGGPIGRFQAIQALVADSACDLEIARLSMQKAALMHDMGQPSELAATIAKYVASEAAFRSIHSSMRIYGGIGYTTDMDVERRLRDAQLFLTGPISSEMARNFIAERHGLGKSYSRNWVT